MSKSSIKKIQVGQLLHTMVVISIEKSLSFWFKVCLTCCSHSTLRCIHRPILVPLSLLINWYYTFICPIEVFGYRPTQLNHTTKYLSSMHVSLFQVNIALRCFLHSHGISRKKRGTMSYSYRITSRVLYSARCHRHHCTLHAFEHFGALYRHNLDDPTRIWTQ